MRAERGMRKTQFGQQLAFCAHDKLEARDLDPRNTNAQGQRRRRFRGFGSGCRGQHDPKRCGAQRLDAELPAQQRQRVELALHLLRLDLDAGFGERNAPEADRRGERAAGILEFQRAAARGPGARQGPVQAGLARHEPGERGRCAEDEQDEQRECGALYQNV
jgi:hypothetical protein